MNARMRQEFEDWASENGKWSKAVERSPDGEYRLMQTSSGWRVWQAAYVAAVDGCMALGCSKPDNRDGAAILSAEASAA